MIDRSIVIGHAVESARTGRISFISAVIAVGCTAGDCTFGRLQPGIEFQLALQGIAPILSGRGRGRNKSSIRIRKRIGGNYILIALMRMAGTDSPGPVPG
ncbi:hypothetical protein D3C75_383830 [compost metagenome]